MQSSLSANQALEAATKKQNQFFDLFFGSEYVRADMHAGSLSFRVPIVGKLISIFAGPAKKELAIKLLNLRGWNGAWKKFKYPSHVATPISEGTVMVQINEMANQCVPDAIDPHAGVGLSLFDSPYTEHFEVLSISLPIIFLST